MAPTWKQLTWKEFYAGKIPSSTDAEDVWTAFSFNFLRKEFVVPDSPLLVSFMKWGSDFLKDVMALKFFTDAKTQMHLSDREAAIMAGNVLKKVDWDLVQKVFESGAADYTAYCHRTGEGGKIQACLDGLTYALTLREIPGLREPGDLFKKLTE